MLGSLRTRSHLLPAGALLLSLVPLGLAAPVHASAAPACWQRLVNDWTDGRIDHAHPVRCYRQALDDASGDLLAYSSLPSDLSLGLVRVVDGTVPPGQVNAQGGPRYARAVREQGRPAEGHSGRKVQPGPRTTPGRREASFLAAGRSQLPLPLASLVATGLLLLATGAASMLVRRRLRRVR